MDNLAEAITLIQDTAKEAAAVEVVTTDKAPRRFWMRNGTELTELATEAPYRGHQARDIDSLMALARDAAVSPSPIVWHCHERIVLVHDDVSRRDATTMTLAVDPRFAAIKALACKAYDQKSLLRLLRVDLHGTHNGDLLTAAKSIKISSQSEASATVEHGKQGLGKAVMAQATNADLLPDEITFGVATYVEFPDWSHQIRCAVDLDLDDATFRIMPLAGEIQSAIDATQDQIDEALGELVQGSDVKIYYGAN
jgi:hypothetical protein